MLGDRYSMRVIDRLGYGIGQMSDGVKQAAFNTFLFFYYNQVLGLSGSLAGMAALLALVADAITDPMVGQISDRFQSRWGRRHPFMLVGAIPFGLAIYVLFNPMDGLTEYQLFAWMVSGAIAVRLMLTLFYVPHMALGAELVKDYYERTSLIGYRVFFTYAGILITSVAGFLFFFPATEEYANGMLNAESYPGFGLFCAVLGMFAMLLSVYSTRTAIPTLSRAVESKTRQHAVFAVMNVMGTLKQHSFRILFAVILMITVLAGVIQTLLIYVSTYVFGFEPIHMGGLVMSLLLGIVFASVTAQKLSRRFDKRNALGIGLVVGSLLAFAPSCLYLMGALDGMSITERFILIFILNGLSQIFFISNTILTDSMLSDIIDEHQLNTGHREEGLYFAARSFATKASYGLGSFFAGVGLDIIDFPTAASPENVPAEAISSLAIFAGPVLMFLFISTIFISSRYRLSKQRHDEILIAIEQSKLKPV